MKSRIRACQPKLRDQYLCISNQPGGRNDTWTLLPPWNTPNMTQLLDGSPRRIFRAGFVVPLPLWW